MQVNIKSLEDVVRRYIALAEYKTESARNESHQCVLDIDDLDQPDTPERYDALLCFKQPFLHLIICLGRLYIAGI